MDIGQSLDWARRLRIDGDVLGSLHVYRSILATDPTSVAAWSGLALINREFGTRKEVAESVHRFAMLCPADPVAIAHWGLALWHQGHREQACAILELALIKGPDWREFYFQKARFEFTLERFEAAAATLGAALGRWPADPELYLELGRSQRMLGQLEQAILSWHESYALEPASMDTLQFLAAAELERNQFESALLWAEKMSVVEPGWPLVPQIRAQVFLKRQEYTEAGLCFERAVLLSPGSAQLWHQLGVCRFELRAFPEAAEAFQRAVACDESLVSAWYNLGRTWEFMGHFEDACEVYRRVRLLEPNHLGACAGEVESRRWMCDWRGIESLELNLLQALAASLENGSAEGFPLLLHALISDNEEEHLQLAMSLADEMDDRPPFFKAQRVSQRADSQTRRIRVGYVTFDCRDHPVAHLLTNLLESHDRARVEVWLYSAGPPDAGAPAKRMKQAVDVFSNVFGMSDGDLAQKIQTDQVDVLVDLMGHTRGDRLGMFSYRPAPVQVSWLGYPGTTGAKFMDYLIADEVVLPVSSQAYSLEKIAYLPHCYQPNDSRAPIPSRVVRKNTHGLPEDTFVYACFCRSMKLDPVMFGTWMNILQRVPASVLWLYATLESVRENLRGEAQRHGVDPKRLVFASRLDRAAHLSRLPAADLMLDTRIYNGHTTTSDALWAGVPVLTLTGAHFASRVSTSLLRTQGLTDGITQTIQAYEDAAVRFATEPSHLAEYRMNVARSRESQPLFQTQFFAAHLETLYEKMSHRAGRGLGPTHLYSR